MLHFANIGSRNLMPFTAPTAANKPRTSSYQLLKPTALSGRTSKQAVCDFCFPG